MAADYPGRMNRGLYIAASGMLAEEVRQNQIANDLANASTSGYRPDRSAQAEFGSLLLANTRTGQAVGSMGTGVQIAQIATDLTPGPIRDTGEPLDFAIEGAGFFAIQGAGGRRYTRDGQFSVSANGTLVTAQGAQVLSQAGGAIRVGADGKVDPKQIGIFDVPNARKAGDGTFTGGGGGRPAGAVVRGGALEGSGADPTRSMVDMIASLRAFEAGQKVITTIDETMGRSVSTVGAVTS